MIRKLVSVVFLFLMLLTAPFVLSGCGQSKEARDAADAMSGELDVRQMATQTVPGKISTSFFLVIGSIETDAPTARVKFAWHYIPTDEYIYSSVPLDHVRMKLRPGLKRPMIKFMFHDHDQAGQCPSNPSEIVERCVTGIVVICAPDQWPITIQVPTLKETPKPKPWLKIGDDEK